MLTVANTYGGTAHVSSLLRKTKRLGLLTADALLALAVKRGCSHYASASDEAAQVKDPGLDTLPNAELGMAMISGAQAYDPQYVRCAAQLLSDPQLEPVTLSRLAKMERCEPLLRYIAQQAEQWDEGRTEHWQALLAALSPRIAIPFERWPHRSRFMQEAGYRRGGGTHPARWLRPTQRPHDQ